ncbi:hypothetical protein ANO11243_033470 [Dothideomycetidae sp. 11243]|nr:hypothetical protein ANO11243_033470 [fungal sp. No.11243]
MFDDNRPRRAEERSKEKAAEALYMQIWSSGPGTAARANVPPNGRGLFKARAVRLMAEENVPARWWNGSFTSWHAVNCCNQSVIADSTVPATISAAIPCPKEQPVLGLLPCGVGPTAHPATSAERAKRERATAAATAWSYATCLCSVFRITLIRPSSAMAPQFANSLPRAFAHFSGFCPVSYPFTAPIITVPCLFDSLTSADYCIPACIEELSQSQSNLSPSTIETSDLSGAPRDSVISQRGNRNCFIIDADPAYHALTTTQESGPLNSS